MYEVANLVVKDERYYIIVFINPKIIFDPHSFCVFFHTNIFVIKGTPNFAFDEISVDIDLNGTCQDRLYGCEALTQEVTLKK